MNDMVRATIEGKKAKIDAYIIEWLRTHLDG